MLYLYIIQIKWGGNSINTAKNMKTFKIIGKTNGWIASRDIAFNGKTEVEILTGLSESEAKSKLEDFCYDDYSEAVRIDSLEEFVKEYMIGGFFDYIENESSVDLYFEKLKKVVVFLWKNKSLFCRFDGAGIYRNGSLILELNGNSYEHDSRYYGIVEE